MKAVDVAPFYCTNCGGDAVSAGPGLGWMLTCGCTSKLDRETIAAKNDGHCATCRWWAQDLSDETDARYLPDRPDGWGYCRYSMTNGNPTSFIRDPVDRTYSTVPNPRDRLAGVLETDQSLGVLATAPDYSCVAWEGQPR